MRKINKYFIAAVLVLVFMQFSAGLFAKTQKKIKMISTCGMIAQRYSYSKREKIPTVSPLEVVKAVPELREMAEIEIEEFSNINASLMTPQKMYDLAVSAWKTLKDPEVAGVVIIYGTETIEEAAFLTELLIDSEKPIVMTGAQRNPSDPSADGPANLVDAVLVALDDESRNRGTLVVFNNKIFSAKEVSKVNSNGVDSLQSPYGPVGTIQSGRVIYLRPREKRFTLDAADASRKVQLIKMVPGMDALFLRVAITGGAEAVVIEGFGAGTLNEDNFLAIDRAFEQKMPVVIVSRCGSGFVDAGFDSQFAGKRLADKGVIFGGDLTGPKARILLILALSKTFNTKEIQGYFDRLYTR